jgi:hypothetical protein
VQLYAAWRKAGAVAELHIYERGGHGFDLKPKSTTSDHWFDEFIWWMRSRGPIVPSKRKPRDARPRFAERRMAGFSGTRLSRLLSGTANLSHDSAFRFSQHATNSSHSGTDA